MPRLPGPCACDLASGSEDSLRRVPADLEAADAAAAAAWAAAAAASAAAVAMVMRAKPTSDSLPDERGAEPRLSRVLDRLSEGR